MTKKIRNTGALIPFLMLPAFLLSISTGKPVHASPIEETYGEIHSFEPDTVLSFSEPIGDAYAEIIAKTALQHGENMLSIIVLKISQRYAAQQIDGELFVDVTDGTSSIRIELGELSGCHSWRHAIASYPLMYPRPATIRLVFRGSRKAGNLCLTD